MKQETRIALETVSAGPAVVNNRGGSRRRSHAPKTKSTRWEKTKVNKQEAYLTQQRDNDFTTILAILRDLRVLPVL
jgi:hypothetical protein